ncbi:two-component system sensor histidine kinase TcrY [Jatrophihabitans fulvus]
MVPATLRGRLTAVLALVVTFALAAAAAISVLVVRRVLTDRLDDELRAAGARFSAGLESDRDGDDRYDLVEGQLAGTLGARIRGGRVVSAAVVRADRDLRRPLPRAALDRLGGVTPSSSPRSLDLEGVGDYRVLGVRGRNGDVLVTGLPTESIESTIHKLAAVVLAVFAGALLVIVLLAAGLLRRMLRPLTRVAATATEVAALPLDRQGVPQRARPGPGGSEIDALARAVNAMLDQVDSALAVRGESERRLRRFVADASHELRTPAAVVRSHAELALREGGDTLPSDVERSLRRIAAQGERLGHLVEDLLLLARLDSGRPPARDPVDVVRLALDAVDDARTAAPDHRWRLALPDHPVEVRGDAHALGQVVSNLLSNAAVHTAPGTTVTVGVTIAATSLGDRVRLVVADDGDGMPPELAGHAFDRFVRGGGERTTSRGSSGLGLAIVRAAVEAHGGRVDLDSGPSGTSVEVDLPAS